MPLLRLKLSSGKRFLLRTQPKVWPPEWLKQMWVKNFFLVPLFFKVILKLTCSPVSTWVWSATRGVEATMMYLPVLGDWDWA